ncbi:MAG: hypothetical protein FWB86_14440, partial [Treponema sp.]|nr:hypothetical protein [Treponema sp.]MCL2252436.1 hypothetical protein [Treponema sp.]
AGSDENDRLTGAWEVMTVPAENVPASGLYICNGVPTSGTIIGTYRVNTSSTTDTTSKFHEANITKSMFVGYMTDINYEGAYLKHVLY